MSDDGRTECIITRDEKKRLVIQRFPKPREWVGYDPANAVLVGEAMAKEAYYLQTGLTPETGPAHGMADQIRARLVNTVALMIASMGREGKNPDHQARQIVDHCLSRIF